MSKSNSWTEDDFKKVENIGDWLRKMPVKKAMNVIEYIKLAHTSFTENKPSKLYRAGAVNWDETDKISFRQQDRFGMMVINDKWVCKVCQSNDRIKTILFLKEGDVLTSVRSCPCGNLIFARDYLNTGIEKIKN